MKLHELSKVEGSTHRRKVVGRGPGSGHGKTSGRGEKVKKLEVVEEFTFGLKVVKLHYIRDFQEEVSQMLDLQLNMLL